MTNSLREKHGYKYIDTEGDSDRVPVVLLHGLLGEASNWATTIDALAALGYRVIVPVIPIDSLPVSQTTMDGVVQYVRAFINALDLDTVVLVGNSLGGQIALVYVLNYPESVVGLILSGSSGIYEVEVGTTTFRRRDRDFIRRRAAVTFFDPVHVTDELVDRIYDLANDRNRALRVIKLARNSLNDNLNDRLCGIEVPTVLIWGSDDKITPPDVAIAFQQSLPFADLHFIEQCGHAPMMERPEAFNKLAVDFLGRLKGEPALSPLVNS